MSLFPNSITENQKCTNLSIQCLQYTYKVKKKNNILTEASIASFFFLNMKKELLTGYQVKVSKKNTGINIIIFSALTEHLYKTEAKTPV